MINVKKLKEISVPRHGIYLSASTDEIFINGIIDSENNGLIIFDHDLHKKSALPFPKNNDNHYAIHSFFKKFSHDEFLFYCPDDNFFIYANTKDNVSSIIPINSPFDNIHFSQLYWWDDTLLLLSDYDGNFYQVLVDQKTILPVEKSKIKKLDNFFEFYQQALDAKPETIYQASYQYIFINEDRTTITFADFLKNNSVTVPNPCPEAYDYTYQNGLFLCVSEYSIGIISSEDKEPCYIKLTGSHRFFRAAFLNDTTFVTLSARNEKSYVTTYPITRE